MTDNLQRIDVAASVHMHAQPPGQSRTTTRVLLAERAKPRRVGIGCVGPTNEQRLRTNRWARLVELEENEQRRCQRPNSRSSAGSKVTTHCFHVAATVITVGAVTTHAGCGCYRRHLDRFRCRSSGDTYARSKYQPQERGQYLSEPRRSHVISMPESFQTSSHIISRDCDLTTRDRTHPFDNAILPTIVPVDVFEPSNRIPSL
jgi:hypothetical protein